MFGLNLESACTINMKNTVAVKQSMKMELSVQRSVQ